MLDKMSKNMGQPIIVENRPGAGGNSGTGAAAHAAPDGYTLVGGGSGPVAANLTLYKTLGYDPEKDFEMISPFAGFTIVVVASKKLPVHSLKELVDYAKANPGKLNYGSVGIGSLAASGRRVFRPDQRRQADPRALSQHRPVRPRPDRRHGAARLPVVSERRRPDPGQGRQSRSRSRATSASPITAGHADHHRSRHAAIQGARLVRAAGAGTARRSRSWKGSTRK